MNPLEPTKNLTSSLAKLLASENLTIEFGNFTTAFFNPKKRILGLPEWYGQSKDVSDLLVGHEVGHAIFTPESLLTRFQSEKRFNGIPFDVLNIVEDIRIERKIQDRFPGLIGSFRRGYQGFLDRDMFKLDSTPLPKRTFLDRLNLHAKVGTLIEVPLSEDEMKLYELCYSADSDDDVLDACVELANSISQNPDNNEHEESESESESGEGNPQPDYGDSEASPGFSDEEANDPSNSDDADIDSEDESEGDNGGAGADSEGDSDDDSEDDSDGGAEGDSDGDSSASDSESDNGDSDSKKSSASTLNTQPETTIDANELLSESLHSLSQSLAEESKDTGLDLPSHINLSAKRALAQVRTYERLTRKRKSSKKPLLRDIEAVKHLWSIYLKRRERGEVAHMVSQFKREQAAARFSKSRVSNTGTINMNKLHSYKTDDNIFKSIRISADGKNHGISILVDFSGSMGSIMTNVCAQIIDLVLFCRKVNIPFQVHTFTSESRSKSVSCLENLQADIDFRDLAYAEVVSSRLSSAEQLNALMDLAADCNMLHEIAIYIREHYRKSEHDYSGLSEKDIDFMRENNFYCYYGIDMYGTPLAAALLVHSYVLKKFADTHGLEKVANIILSDGASEYLKVNIMDQNSGRIHRHIFQHTNTTVQTAFGPAYMTDHIYHDEKYEMSFVTSHLRAAKNDPRITNILFYLTTGTSAFRASTAMLDIFAYRNPHGRWADGSIYKSGFACHNFNKSFAKKASKFFDATEYTCKDALDGAYVVHCTCSYHRNRQDMDAKNKEQDALRKISDVKADKGKITAGAVSTLARAATMKGNNKNIRKQLVTTFISTIA